MQQLKDNDTLHTLDRSQREQAQSARAAVEKLFAERSPVALYLDIDGTLLDMALTSKLSAEYRRRALWEPLDVAQATTITVDTPEGPGSFKLIKGPLGWMDPQNPAERISTEAVTDFLDSFAGLKAERYVEHAAESGKLYGLEPPRKTVTVTTQGGQKRTVLLGYVCAWTAAEAASARTVSSTLIGLPSSLKTSVIGTAPPASPRCGCGSGKGGCSRCARRPRR